MREFALRKQELQQKDEEFITEATYASECPNGPIHFKFFSDF